MEKIRLELSDWLYNAGIVGICKILKYNEIEYEAKNNYIELEVSALDNFEEYYFKYFMDKYVSFTSWYKLVSFEDRIVNFDENKTDEKYLTELNKYIENLKSKLKSASYKSAYNIIQNEDKDLLKEEKMLKKIAIKKKERITEVIPKIKEQHLRIHEIISYLRKDDVSRYILAKNIIYDVIAKFWSDVSFLHKSNSKNDMYMEYHSYFVEELKNYNELSKDKFKYNCFTCSKEIKNLSKPNSYDLTWINKMGVDMSRKTSHFWNLYGDTFICPICNLVYSCIPAGFTVIRDKGLFINQNADIRMLVRVNNTSIDNNTSFEELQEKSYFEISDNMNQSVIEKAEKEIDNIQIVKLDSSNISRPYTFNIMSKRKLKIINSNKKSLRGLVNANVKLESGEYINLYSEVMGRLYDNRNLFDLISKLFHLNLKGDFKRISNLKQIIKINNSYMGGIMGRSVYYKDIDEIQKLGLELRKLYSEKKSENKINGISYRMLNALRTKNTEKFMDTLVNSYMYMNKPIPVKFIEVLKDEGKFQTIGYSFLLGLQGENGTKDKKEEGSKDE